MHWDGRSHPGIFLVWYYKGKKYTRVFNHEGPSPLTEVWADIEEWLCLGLSGLEVVALGPWKYL